MLRLIRFILFLGLVFSGRMIDLEPVMAALKTISEQRAAAQMQTVSGDSMAGLVATDRQPAPHPTPTPPDIHFIKAPPDKDSGKQKAPYAGAHPSVGSSITFRTP
ncbi:MAG: hypothetical protein ACE5DK_11985 [Paracoccaceae bacterium]